MHCFELQSLASCIYRAREELTIIAYDQIKDQYGLSNDDGRVTNAPQRADQLPCSYKHSWCYAKKQLPNELQNTHVALVHIPMSAYTHFLRPIAQLLLHNTDVDDEGETIEPTKPWKYWHPLVNISIAHNECSIACPREQADTLFAPVIAGLRPELQKAVTISKDDYSVVVIGGEGLEAGQRVLDLSSPLALAKM